jgi:hypothetical protein
VWTRRNPQIQTFQRRTTATFLNPLQIPRRRKRKMRKKKIFMSFVIVEETDPGGLMQIL